MISYGDERKKNDEIKGHQDNTTEIYLLKGSVSASGTKSLNLKSRCLAMQDPEPSVGKMAWAAHQENMSVQYIPPYECY